MDKDLMVLLLIYLSTFHTTESQTRAYAYAQYVLCMLDLLTYFFNPLHGDTFNFSVESWEMTYISETCTYIKWTKQLLYFSAASFRSHSFFQHRFFISVPLISRLILFFQYHFFISVPLLLPPLFFKTILSSLSLHLPPLLFRSHPRPLLHTSRTHESSVPTQEQNQQRFGCISTLEFGYKGKPQPLLDKIEFGTFTETLSFCIFDHLMELEEKLTRLFLLRFQTEFESLFSSKSLEQLYK